MKSFICAILTKTVFIARDRRGDLNTKALEVSPKVKHSDIYNVASKRYMETKVDAFVDNSTLFLNNKCLNQVTKAGQINNIVRINTSPTGLTLKQDESNLLKMVLSAMPVSEITNLNCFDMRCFRLTPETFLKSHDYIPPVNKRDAQRGTWSARFNP